MPKTRPLQKTTNLDKRATEILRSENAAGEDGDLLSTKEVAQWLGWLRSRSNSGATKAMSGRRSSGWAIESAITEAT